MSCLCCHYAWLPPGAVSAFCWEFWLFVVRQLAGQLLGSRYGPLGVIINFEQGCVFGCVFGDSSCALIFSSDPASKPSHWAPQDQPRATCKCESLCPMHVGTQIHTHTSRNFIKGLHTCMQGSYTHMGSGICKDTDVNIKAKNEKIHLQDPTHVRKRGWRGLQSHSPHFVMHTQSQRSVVWELKARQEQQSIARTWGSETSPFAGCQAPLANTEQQNDSFSPSVQQKITNYYYYVFLTDSQDICFMLSRPSTCKVSTILSLNNNFHNFSQFCHKNSDSFLWLVICQIGNIISMTYWSKSQQ